MYVIVDCSHAFKYTYDTYWILARARPREKNRIARSHYTHFQAQSTELEKNGLYSLTVAVRNSQRTNEHISREHIYPLTEFRVPLMNLTTRNMYDARVHFAPELNGGGGGGEKIWKNINARDSHNERTNKPSQHRTRICLHRHPATRQKLGLTGTTDIYLSFGVAHYICSVLCALCCVLCGAYVWKCGRCGTAYHICNNIMYGRMATKCHLPLLQSLLLRLQYIVCISTWCTAARAASKWIMHKKVRRLCWCWCGCIFHRTLFTPFASTLQMYWITKFIF